MSGILGATLRQTRGQYPGVEWTFSSRADCDLRVPVAVLLGGEGGGLPDSLVALSTTRLSIPMQPPVESLNVATAAALIAYEAQRQRGGASS